MFCDPLPIQIGNYVWEDTDEDGVQDACEDPIEGLPVTLYTKADDGSLTQVATTTTSATGEYYFTGDGTTGETWTNTGEAIIADTSYVIVFGDQSGETIMLAGLEYELTAALTGEGNGPTLNDSDGVLFDLNGTMVPAICYNTADTTDHTLDVGLLPISTFDLALRKSLASGQSNMAAANDEVVFTITVFNQGTLGASDVEVTDYLPTNTTYSATSSTATGMLTSGGNDVVNLTNNGGGTFSLDTLPPMDSVSFNLALTIDAAASGTLTNTAEIVAATGGMDEDSPLTSVIGMSDDDSELASNDDINDDGLDTPGTEDLMGDEDDYDLEQIIICNLSITSIDAACQPNQTGKYDVTVNLSYENGPGGLITATLGTGQMASSTATTAGSGTTTITFTGLSSTNMAGITVDVAFDDAANCNAQSTFDAPVNCCPLPQPICEMDNESYTLTADPGLTNYQWSVDGTPISGADQQSY
ncbi:MAG: SdrD B-like domain-containing protein, partial [Bacteroidota bacterium]